MTFQPGDKVVWLHCPSGGYAYQMNVAGVVQRVNAKTVTILVARRRYGRWVTMLKRVRLESLRKRSGFCEPVDGVWEAR